MGLSPGLPAIKVRVFMVHPNCLIPLQNVVSVATDMQTRQSGNTLSSGFQWLPSCAVDLAMPLGSRLSSLRKSGPTGLPANLPSL